MNFSRELQLAEQSESNLLELARDRNVSSKDLQKLEKVYRAFQENIRQNGSRAEFFGGPGNQKQVFALTQIAESLGILALPLTPDYSTGRDGDHGDRLQGYASFIQSYSQSLRATGAIEPEELFYLLELGFGNGNFMSRLRKISDYKISPWGVADRFMLDGRQFLGCFVQAESPLSSTAFMEWFYTSMASAQLRENPGKWRVLMNHPFAFAAFLKEALPDPEKAFCGADPEALRFYARAGKWCEEEVQLLDFCLGIQPWVEEYLNEPINFVRKHFCFPDMSSLPWYQLYAQAWGRTELAYFQNSVWLTDSTPEPWDTVYSSFGLTHYRRAHPHERGVKYGPPFFKQMLDKVHPERGLILTNAFRESATGVTRFVSELDLQTQMGTTRSWVIGEDTRTSGFVPQMIAHAKTSKFAELLDTRWPYRSLETFISEPIHFFFELFQALLAEALQEEEEESEEMLEHSDWAKVERNYPRCFQDFLLTSPTLASSLRHLQREESWKRALPHLARFFHIAEWERNLEEEKALRQLSTPLLEIILQFRNEFRRQRKSLLARTPAARFFHLRGETSSEIVRAI